MTKHSTSKTIKRLQNLDVTLDDATVALAHELGDGNLSLGLRRAVAIAALRNSKCEHTLKTSCQPSAVNEFLGLCWSCPF